MTNVQSPDRKGGGGYGSYLRRVTGTRNPKKVKDLYGPSDLQEAPTYDTKVNPLTYYLLQQLLFLTNLLSKVV